jgi:large subunit ribosomal protein L31
MQKKIHPIYHANSKAACVCGATYVVGSTKDVLAVEICSACHPFYTGKENILDTAGRLDRFNKRRALATTKTKKAA